MNLVTTKSNGSKGSTIEVSQKVFGADYNEALIHQVVVAEMAAHRSGTKAQKNRSAVRGGGAKPWRQKGTGRARAGTSRSPIWRTGGVTFAASPRSYKQKINRKMFQGALCSALSEIVRTENLKIVKELSLDAPKTKLAIGLLKKLKIDGSVLLISSSIDENLYLATRNLHEVCLLPSEWVNPWVLMSFDTVVVTEEALKVIEERLS